VALFIIRRLLNLATGDYTRINFVKNAAPPMNDVNMNKIDAKVYEIDQALAGTNSTVSTTIRNNLGAAAKTLSDTTNPTTSTVGIIGQFYINTITNALYQCTAIASNVYTWARQGSSMILLQSYTTAGSYVFTIPIGITEIAVFMIGGGGSGALCTYTNYTTGYAFLTGGGSGYFNAVFQNVTSGNTKSVVIGAGGTAISGSGVYLNGNSGGSTSFDGIIASGGTGGNQGFSTNGSTAGIGASGGQYSRYLTASVGDSIGNTPYGGMPVFYSYNVYSNPIVALLGIDNAKLDMAYSIIKSLPFSFAAGGASGAYYYNSTYSTGAYESALTLPTGRTSSAGISQASIATGVKGTDYGCGGGSVTTGLVASSSAAGADGAVFIYGR
jgi:hypothetical protein